MANIVYGVFLTADAAHSVTVELGKISENHFGHHTQVHNRGYVEAQLLPESAREAGKNTARAIGLGAEFGILAGASLGASGMANGVHTP